MKSNIKKRKTSQTRIEERPIETPIVKSLEELLDRMTKENQHTLVDFGPAIGKETW